MLIFATANTFFQLNLVFIAKSPTGFRSGILWKYELKVRSSHWSCSVKIGVLKYFANFTGKHLCWSLFLTESSGLQLFKKVSPTQVFSFGICENFKNTYFEENLLLKPVQISSGLPTNTPRGLHVGTTWKRPFPRRFNVESTWCVCRVIL